MKKMFLVSCFLFLVSCVADETGPGGDSGPKEEVEITIPDGFRLFLLNNSIPNTSGPASAGYLADGKLIFDNEPDLTGEAKNGDMNLVLGLQFFDHIKKAVDTDAGKSGNFDKIESVTVTSQIGDKTASPPTSTANILTVTATLNPKSGYALTGTTELVGVLTSESDDLATKKFVVSNPSLKVIKNSSLNITTLPTTASSTIAGLDPITVVNGVIANSVAFNDFKNSDGSDGIRSSISEASLEEAFNKALIAKPIPNVENDMFVVVVQRGNNEGAINTTTAWFAIYSTDQKKYIFENGDDPHNLYLNLTVTDDIAPDGFW